MSPEALRPSLRLKRVTTTLSRERTRGTPSDGEGGLANSIPFEPRPGTRASHDQVILGVKQDVHE